MKGIKRFRQAIKNQRDAGEGEFRLTYHDAEETAAEIEKEYGWAAGVPAPRDAEGREIPLGTEVLYHDDGGKCDVAYWEYHPHEKDRWIAVSNVSGTRRVNRPKVLYLTSPDLLPCPFCGGEAVMVDAEIDGRVHYIAKCATCYSTTDIMQMSKSKAAEAWNRRAEPEPERTCHAITTVKPFSQTQELHVKLCSSCDYVFGSEERRRLPPYYEKRATSRMELPNYCPNCGAKVVEDV